MSNAIQSRQFFGFKDAATGHLAGLQTRDDESGTGTYFLRKGDEFPAFEVASQDELSLALVEGTFEMNSRRTCPSWGDFSAGELVPVRVTVAVTLEELEHVAPRQVTSWSVRDIPYVLAKSYAGGVEGLPQKPQGIAFWLVVLPENMTLADALAWEGLEVYGRDKYSRRKVYKVLPVPEDYLDLFDGKNVALFLASEIRY